MRRAARADGADIRAGRMRIAVLGLYNSGSTCVAGILDRLGVDMGAPFWASETDNYYEHMRRHREASVRELAAALHIATDETRIGEAVAWIRPPGGEVAR